MAGEASTATNETTQGEGSRRRGQQADVEDAMMMMVMMTSTFEDQAVRTYETLRCVYAVCMYKIVIHKGSH